MVVLRGCFARPHRRRRSRLDPRRSCDRQWLWRENRGLVIRLKNAQFKISASLEDLDYRSSRGLKRAQIEQLVE